MADHKQNRGSLLRLALFSCVAGTATGFLGAVFRIALRHADQWRDAWITRAHGWAPGLLLTAGAVAGLSALAAWLVDRISPYAGGSGIPHVEGVLKRELPPAPFSLLPVKLHRWMAGDW